MYNIFKTVIGTGRFDLNELVSKVDRYTIEGKITEAQRDELLTQARSYADPNYSFGSSWQDEVLRLWSEVRALKAQIAELHPVEEVPVDPDAPVEEPVVVDEWPDYVQPTGAHDAYPLGAKITYNDLHYISLIANNVWTPAAYPAGWQVHEPETQP